MRSTKGASAEILRRVFKTPLLFRIHISVPLLFEYEEQLQRVTGLTYDETETILLFFQQHAWEHDIHFLFRGMLPDDDDAMILELAVKAQASIITHNVRDFNKAIEYGIHVETPGKFLQRIPKNLL